MARLLADAHAPDRQRRRASGTVDYPELACSGVAAFVELEGQTLHMQETITAGSGCIPTAPMTLTLVGPDSADWVYDSGTAVASLSKS